MGKMLDMSDFFQNIVGKVESVLGGDVQTLLKQQLQSLTQPQTIQSLLDRADQAGLGDKVRAGVRQGSKVTATPEETHAIQGSVPVPDLLAALTQAVERLVKTEEEDAAKRLRSGDEGNLLARRLPDPMLAALVPLPHPPAVQVG